MDNLKLKAEEHLQEYLCRRFNGTVNVPELVRFNVQAGFWEAYSFFMERQQGSEGDAGRLLKKLENRKYGMEYDASKECWHLCSYNCFGRGMLVASADTPMELLRALEGNSDGDDMALPDGKTCNNCVHKSRCFALYGISYSNTRCDFSPSRFKERQQGREGKSDE